MDLLRPSPSILKSGAFKVWKDEAFALWRSDWAAVYDEGDAARAVVEGVADSHVLVNIVDNDYVNGDIFAPFSSLFYLP